MSALIPEVIDRPTSDSKAVRGKALDEMMKEVIEWFGKEWEDRNEQETREQLDDELYSGRDGYEVAKSLDYDGWCPDSDLVEILDRFGGMLHGACYKAEKEWVKETGVKPKYKLGDVIAGKWGKDVVTGPITRINEETAYYTIRRPGDADGCGACVKYEDVKEPA